MDLESVIRGRVYDLAHPLEPSMPVSPNHPGYRMALLRRHGDVVRPDGGSAANRSVVASRSPPMNYNTFALRKIHAFQREARCSFARAGRDTGVSQPPTWDTPVVCLDQMNPRPSGSPPRSRA